MNTTCPRCNALLEPNTSFCTSCGAVLATQNPQNPYSQQGTPSTPQNPYAQPYGQQQAQVPPWASAGNAGYASYGQPQQASGGQIDPSAGGSLGFGGQGDGTAKKILTIGVTIIAITIVLLIVFGILAWAIPALHCLFLGFIVLLFVIPWFIYSYIRNMIRRSVGGVGRLF